MGGAGGSLPKPVDNERDLIAKTDTHSWQDLCTAMFSA
ncbi:hypothetical protein ADIMK_3092 [Marinobacterium lacunae]|uniref:Uncharacterized protein n=1 Tax=Marinobacterium lacunae TaxID=1232683 RepID=A0A081FVR5_9GAMM|nr:hypothetical protein ADIMK_3092 [Marinobacterium lacunae]